MSLVTTFAIIGTPLIIRTVDIWGGSPGKHTLRMTSSTDSPIGASALRTQDEGPYPAHRAVGALNRANENPRNKMRSTDPQIRRTFVSVEDQPAGSLAAAQLRRTLCTPTSLSTVLIGRNR